MTRVTVLKQMIRLGMRVVPNHTLAYRLCAQLSPLVVHPPADCQVDRLRIAHCEAWWLACRHHCDARVVLYLHGGGYVIGSNRTHLELAGRLARAARAQVLMLEYRLAPEHPYPGALEDARMAYDYLLAQRIRADQIVLAGDSAGGGLALALAMHLRDEGQPVPAGVMCLSPWLDITCSLSSESLEQTRDPLISPARIRHFAQLYAAEHDPAHPGLSPFFGDLSGLPPILIQVGEDEVLVPECLHLAERAQAQGASLDLQVWPGMFHVWHFAARLLPEARQAISRLGLFAREVTGTERMTTPVRRTHAVWPPALPLEPVRRNSY